MTDLIFNETMTRLIDEGRRLHKAICEWGVKHGVRAYRVVTENDAWFEIWNPKNKMRSRKFPERISMAIQSHTDAIEAYAEYTRLVDANFSDKDRFAHHPGIGSVDKLANKNSNRKR